MATVTPQSLSSFEFYEPLTKKITFFAIAVQPSLGWEVSPCAQTTMSHSAAAQQCASGLFPAGATDCCREAKYFSLGRQPAHWDRHFSFSEKHHWSFKSQLLRPVNFSCAWWVVSPALLQFPALTEGLFRSPVPPDWFPRVWIRPLQRRVSSTEGTGRNSSSGGSGLPGSRCLAPAPALRRAALTEITGQSGAVTTFFFPEWVERQQETMESKNVSI